MTQRGINLGLIVLCALSTGLGIWLSASGCEQVSMYFIAVPLAAVPIVLGCVLFGYRLFTKRTAIPVVFAPLLSVLVIISVAAVQWPLRMSYALSQSALDSLAHRVRAGEPWTTPQRVGFFTVRKAEVKSNGIVCLWTHPDPGGNTGFVQCNRGHVPFNLWSIIRLDDRWQFISED